MRQTQIFAGSSHPTLVKDICNRLGRDVSLADLGEFANGETKVSIKTSVRDQDVFIVQSGSPKINDSVMELLVMISACKSGSAKSITAVMPYFPYSRHSKKKSHRGSITARMIANLLKVAGVNHVITLDLHASQMQGFFSCPVDNLVAEPLLAHWIKNNIPNWQKAVVVSKNPGGTKRVTSLADALKLSFGIVMTDRKRPDRHSGKDSMSASLIIDRLTSRPIAEAHGDSSGHDDGTAHQEESTNGAASSAASSNRNSAVMNSTLSIPTTPTRARQPMAPSPLRQQHEQEVLDPQIPSFGLTRVQSAPTVANEYGNTSEGSDDDEEDENESIQRQRDVITGKLVHGHIVDDDDGDSHSSSNSQETGGGGNAVYSGAMSEHDFPTIADPMTSSIVSNASSMRNNAVGHGLGGSGDVGSSDDEDEHLRNPEAHVTLVGNVRDKPVLIVDDMIDKAASWIAAAETVVKRGGATKVYCFATHGLFGEGCLAELDACKYIDLVIVTNSFPIPADAAQLTTKLRVQDVSALLAEAIRRNHHGESISQLYMHHD